MFGFEPITAMYNILEAIRPLLVVAGIVVILTFLLKKEIMLALTTLFVIAFLYFAFQPGVIENIGASTAKILTIETNTPETPAEAGTNQTLLAK